ncbi:methyltransferase-like protein 1 [Phalaenopsis equestris]|uniref:methyltransferase-like protein 1 n=1 Tax=Phalaenopsis equestris TaxID=78828 RepID=UPI0009E3D296|nr:methyltransferase-like protein 1 [Phalaenopsis equestris]XP_020592589.1 methyltransferase-like protein 1 [Phalaenopsis equestris]
MDPLETVQIRNKRQLEEQMDVRQSKYDEDDDRDNVERKRHRSSKSLRFNTTDVEELDSSRRKSSGDKDEGRKKSGGLGQAGTTNEEDYETRRESRSKISRKNTVERSEVRSNEGYHDKELEGCQKSMNDHVDLSSSRKKNSSPGHDSPESKGRSKSDNPPEGEAEKAQDRESRHYDRKDSTREKVHGQRELERNVSTRRRWDDMGSWRKTDEGNYVDRSDPRNGKSSEQGNLRDRASDPRTDSGHARGRIIDSTGEKGVACSSRDGKRGDVERNRGLSESQGDDHKEFTELIRDDKHTKVRVRSPVALTEDMEWHRYGGKSHNEKGEKHKQQHDALHGSRDEVDIMERSDEDTQPRTRDRNGRSGRYNRSPSPEGSRRYHQDLEDHDRGQSESDTERNTAVKGKDLLKDNRDLRTSKGKDGSWNDRNIDRESSKDYWRSQSKQDAKSVNEFDNIRAWDTPSHEPLKMEGDKLHFRPGYKKDNRARSEGGRFENSDSIEIKPNHNLDFVSDVSMSTFPGRRAEVGSVQDSSGAANDDEWCYPSDDKVKAGYGINDDLQEKNHDGVDSPIDQISGRNYLDSQAGKGRGQKGPVNSSRIGQGQSVSGFSQAPLGYNQGSSSFNRGSQQGQKGGKAVRGGRGRMIGRDSQRGGLPMHMMGPPFGHLGLPPGTMQSMGPNMPPSVGPPLGPGVFVPPFVGPLSWPAGRGVDINMLAAPPNLPPIPPGPAGPRFAPNLGAGPNQVMYFNQQSSGRVNSNLPGPEFSSNGPVVRETSIDKAPAIWGQTRTGGPSGKAPSRGEQNDYSQNFVDTGMRPQNFIRELELTSVVEDYPKLRELIQRKDDIVINSSTPPLYYKANLREFTLIPEFFGTKFDVILVDPPWEEYVHRAPGITDHIEYWTFEEIQNLKIEAIADTPSFIFLWVGDGVGLEQGRQCLKKWGFRRCEDICWVKTNKKNATPGLRHDSHTLFQHSKEHCLMGIKGTVRRSTDGHIIHANIDTDIIIAEEPPDGSTKKPDDMYRIIEHFSLGRRRLELFGEDHNIRPGWLTVGKGLTSSNFNAEAYLKNFTDKDGKVWLGGGGRNPPPDAPHLVSTTPEIESLRPKSPPQKSQQPPPMPLITSSANRRPLGSSPQNPSLSSVTILNQEAPTSESGALAPPWLSSMGGFRELESSHLGSSSDKYEGYGLNAAFGQIVGDHVEFDPQRSVNMGMM